MKNHFDVGSQVTALDKNADEVRRSGVALASLPARTIPLLAFSVCLVNCSLSASNGQSVSPQVDSGHTRDGGEERAPVLSDAGAYSKSNANRSDDGSCPLIDDAGLAQMSAIVAAAQSAADGSSPQGHCYAAVARYIDTVGYGKIPTQTADRIGSLPSVPDAYGAYAHQFADYMNLTDTSTGHSNGYDLGLQRLALDNPYDAPAGAIVVVRAGTPGTADPTAGDISIAAGGGTFFNDGNMSYGGPASFPAGNDFVLGIYVPDPDCASEWLCATDEDCNHGEVGTERVCTTSEGVCITGCHVDADCPSGKACAPTEPHYSCQ